MTINGQSFVAGTWTPGTESTFTVHNPATGAAIDPPFHQVDVQDVHLAALAAAKAFDEYRSLAPSRRAAFLNAIADNLESLRSDIVTRATQETGLPAPRIDGEISRTTGQLRLLAREIDRGDLHGVRITEANPDRLPSPAPDMRQRLIPLGPIAIFGASNFPLAFSVAGGDTASALAAGCPVIVKAHSSHAGTAELAGQAIARAITSCDMPTGVFSMLFGPGASIGQALAAHPAIKAIAFTGSQAAGTALMRTAAQRSEPIPVYAEMSSINPVFVLPEAAEERAHTTAEGFVASLTLGAGQFCTNPGLIFVPVGTPVLLSAMEESVISARGQTMLSDGIREAYERGLDRVESLGVPRVATGIVGDSQNAPPAALFVTDASRFLDIHPLQDEVFGAAAIVVTYESSDQLIECAESLQGQLTATIQLGSEDHALAARLLPTLERKAGRIIINGWPTGVEVNDSVVHGGPFPATSDSRVTSVGTLSIHRFLRPVAYQGFPDDLLPEPVRESNPWQIPRRSPTV